ncbi:MAG TPA: CHAD domain-containing protein, partial [Candidatus Binatus sp.]|nr:CHAD domain-containing protein [Candidatus Binatus sp.]
SGSGRRPGPTLPVPPSGPIERGDSVAVAGRKAMEPHVRRLLELDAALCDPDADHDLKRYRVATRRLRAALRTFRDGFGRREVNDLRTRLAELASTAGAARDLDVRIADATRWSDAAGPHASTALAPLLAAWNRERAAAAARLERRLATRKHERLLRDLVSFVEAEAEPGAGAPDRPIGLHAASMLFDGYERLMAGDRVVGGADLATLHAIRIEAKRLRYLLEFLGDILGPERADLVTRLVAVQDHLGALHDAAVTVDALRTFLESSVELTQEEQAAVDAYLLDRERDVSRLRGTIGPAWRGVSGFTFARRLSRAAVAR